MSWGGISYPGVGDQAGDRAEGLYGFCDRSLYGLFVAYIAGDGQGLSPLRLDLLSEVLKELGASRHERHRVPFFGNAWRETAP
jgi:hypothetical protein